MTINNLKMLPINLIIALTNESTVIAEVSCTADNVHYSIRLQSGCFSKFWTIFERKNEKITENLKIYCIFADRNS